MPLEPKNIDEERHLALARCLHRLVQMHLRAGAYPLGPQNYMRLHEVRLELNAVDDVLYSYFLGD